MEIGIIDELIKDNSMTYANSVITDRALIDIRDGNKPIHRRIVYAMHKMNAYSFKKCHKVSGEVMSYSPHADSYPTIVNMAQPDGNIIRYIDGEGNFAQHTSRDLKAGASRYTSCKLSEFGRDVLKELSSNTVDMIDNYDCTLKIPEVLPVKTPNALLFCSEGIAYGMASKIPSFNMIELDNAIVHMLETGEKEYLYPDFATCGQIVKDEAVLKAVNETGRGIFKLRAKAEIVDNVINITEIPYSTTREAIIDKVIELVKTGKLKEITDINDLTGLDGMLIEITCRKNTDMNLILEKLYKMTPLESSYACNMNILNLEGLPKVMGVWDIVEEWLIWRKQCVRIGIGNNIASKAKKLHFLKGLEKVVLDINKAIEIIRNSETDELIISNLSKHFDIDETQAEEIANMKLRKINKENILKQIKDVEKLEEEIQFLQDNMDSEDYVNQQVIIGLKEVTDKFGQPRRTEIIEIDEATKEKITQIKNEVASYNVRVIVTKEGYVKKLSLKAKAEQKLKDGDEVVAEFITNNTQELLVFSGTDCYKVQLDDLSDSNSNALGEYLPTKLEIDTPIGYSVVDGGYKYLAILYNTSKIAKVDLSAFETATKRKKLSNSLHKDSNVVKMITLKGDEQLVLINEKGKEFTIDSNDLNAVTSRSSQGSFPKSKKNIIDFKVLETEE